jgi:gamma-glutamyltranspeptidase / glutathione hydrolase
LTLGRVSFFEHGAVASEQQLASIAGSEAMRDGGNAFDAALATSFALAVAFHPAGGLGGDLFALAYEARTGRVHCLNSSGWAPSGLNVELMKSRGLSSVPVMGPYSVVVPGLAAGALELQRRFGRGDRKKLLAPALSYARDGFPAGEGICRSISGAFDTFSKEARAVFAPSGGPPTPGDWLRQEKLGTTIEAIANGGADAFYRGWPAERIAEALTRLGVPAAKSDFDFRPEWVEPLRLDYRGATVYEVPPNSMGATTLLILKLLAEHDLGSAGPLSKRRVELTMEAAELAYARRDEKLGDPKFGSFDLGEFLDVRPASAKANGPPVRDGDTTVFSATDPEGNVVSVVQSLYHHFGSRVFVEECGIMMSSRGAGFVFSGPNKVEPHKRPLHTLSCLLLDRGKGPLTSIGASGGEYRPMQHALFVTNIVDYGMSLERSVDHPRFLWSGGKHMVAEAGYDTAGLPYEVEAMPQPGRTGVAHGVEVLPRSKKAVCDVRGDGSPSGF